MGVKTRSSKRASPPSRAYKHRTGISSAFWSGLECDIILVSISSLPDEGYHLVRHTKLRVFNDRKAVVIPCFPETSVKVRLKYDVF